MKITRSGKKKASSTRRYLWNLIRKTVGRCGMASWGVPFEAIAANFLISGRKDANKSKTD